MKRLLNSVRKNSKFVSLKIAETEQNENISLFTQNLHKGRGVSRNFRGEDFEFFVW